MTSIKQVNDLNFFILPSLWSRSRFSFYHLNASRGHRRYVRIILYPIIKERKSKELEKKKKDNEKRRKPATVVIHNPGTNLGSNQLFRSFLSNESISHCQKLLVAPDRLSEVPQTVNKYRQIVPIIDSFESFLPAPINIDAQLLRRLPFRFPQHHRLANSAGIGH